jgi:hypothetical protein
MEVAKRYWGGNGPEWDIVSQSIDGNHLLLGEVKWNQAMMTAQELNRHFIALVNKGVPPSIKKVHGTVHYVLCVPQYPEDKKLDSLPYTVITVADILSKSP